MTPPGGAMVTSAPVRQPVPGAQLLPNGGALGPAAKNIVADAMAEIMGGDASWESVKRSIESRGGVISDDDAKDVSTRAREEQKKGAMAQSPLDALSVDAAPKVGPSSTVRPPNEPYQAGPAFAGQSPLGALSPTADPAPPEAVAAPPGNFQPPRGHPAQYQGDASGISEPAYPVDTTAHDAAAQGALVAADNAKINAGKAALYTEGDIGGEPAGLTEGILAHDYDTYDSPGALATTQTPGALTPEKANVNLGGPTPPVNPLDVKKASAGLPEVGKYPSVEPALEGQTPSAKNPNVAAKPNSVTATGPSILGGLLKGISGDGDGKKKRFLDSLDKDDRGMSLLVAGLTMIGHTPKIGESKFKGIATGVQTGLNTAIGLNAAKAKKKDKNFDKRLKVAGIYTDLSIAQSKLQASLNDKSATLEEKKRNNKAMEALRGDMISIKKVANDLAGERNDTQKAKAGLDAVEYYNNVIEKDSMGMNEYSDPGKRRELYDGLVTNVVPESPAAANAKREYYTEDSSRYNDVIRKIDAGSNTPAEKASMKAQAKKVFGHKQKGYRDWFKTYKHALPQGL
jgi:hypothetical protein